MIIEQIYTGCLAQGAYYIMSDGEAAIIDPLREVQPYIDRAKRDNATIKYVFESHFHADFVSGHIDLANKTGATIVYGPNAQTDFPSHIANDNEIFSLGKIKIKLLHTPGHTLESSCFLLIDENGHEHCLFTGDTLFIGDVGRPDLAVKSDLTQEQLAGLLYDSIHEKILPLADDLIIYPAHGAGSACGKNMSTETVSTLGKQRQLNYSLQYKTKEEFVAGILEGLTLPPQYFPKNAWINKHGYESIDEVYEKGLRALDADAFEQVANETHALILDTRNENEFVKGHIPNSIFIGLEGSFAPWVGALITDLQQPILLVCDVGKEEETVTRLARVGYDNTIGFLHGGFATWQNAGKETDQIASITADTLEGLYNEESINILDVRKENEYASKHIEKAQNKPLDYLNNWIKELSKDEAYYVHCAGGYRSVIAISILKARGFHQMINILQGFKGIEQTQLPLEIN